MRKDQQYIAIISTHFPDYSDDVDFCTELAMKVQTATLHHVDDLYEPLEDALTGADDEDTTVSSIFDELSTRGLIRSDGTSTKTAKMSSKTDTKTKDRHTISLKKVEAVFGKELNKRARGTLEVPQPALTCSHKWNNEGSPGVRCQVCDFETTKNSRNCLNDCGIKLCGSCWWKWNAKLS
eukprot:m.8503 g.8503  ORF g.8503 m.8503 type:complete len:180 (+) comp6917_c0_seq1:164-703(+)